VCEVSIILDALSKECDRERGPMCEREGVRVYKRDRVEEK